MGRRLEKSLDVRLRQRRSDIGLAKKYEPPWDRVVDGAGMGVLKEVRCEENSRLEGDARMYGIFEGERLRPAYYGRDIRIVVSI